MKDWKTLVGAVAPALVTALGGPLAGAATQALATSLLGKSDATQDEIATAILTGGTEALTAIKEADRAFETRMRELDIDLERLHQADRNGARQREVDTGDHWTLRALAGLIVGAFVAVLWAVLFGGSTVDGALAGTLIGYLSAKADQVVSYFFGSSAGSKAKTDAMAALAHTKEKP